MQPGFQNAKNSMIYIAAPYTDPNPEVKAERMRQFYEYDSIISSNGAYTVSPLYKVETAKHGKMPDDWEYWKKYSYALLDTCDSIHVLMMPGWDKSIGVQAEIAYCKLKSIQICYIPLVTPGNLKFNQLAIYTNMTKMNATTTTAGKAGAGTS